MISILRNTTYAALFSAQVIALIGTGLLTVALGLLAFDLAGERAGLVLGLAYTIKMVAYVGLSPIAQALVHRLPRKAVLIGADLVRVAVALCLPFVTEVWQVYVLVFVLQSASATFTPAFQAVIPDVLPAEQDYTRALSLSRLAYDLENLISPAAAALLLTVLSYNWLFLGTVLGFAASAALVWSVCVPPVGGHQISRPFSERLTRGTRIYLATPRLRGLLALNLAAASVGAFVLVNTVVLVRAGYGGTETDLARAMACFGAGSMTAALLLPALLDRLPDRPVMLVGAAFLAGFAILAAVILTVAGLPQWLGFLGLWAVLGFFYSCVMTPSGRLLRRSAHSEDRPAVFAAQFALSHACWLLTYPLAGWVGQAFGMDVALGLLGAIALTGLVLARLLWPAESTRELEHEHPDLPQDHPHLRAHHGQRRHAHVFVIDDEHRVWPTQG
ncbi:Predicted arabinose efflux permease, MFS family [Roseovarius litoreus]|uniref:Predicted arabinose efflux permease, MFS family n=1 Tax=Roseovarius litoreus TaxID=1155722 RepID=A0A1M7I1T7_9RHOB|nr:MFS transporter [Roseovarius litoreus]SHM34357.1 Predicted arabinose efflux permease, MFS family [Roseovarius litoreus]